MSYYKKKWQEAFLILKCDLILNKKKPVKDWLYIHSIET